MNKHCGRWVFSKVRGCLMVVAEVARGQGKGGRSRGESAGSSAREHRPWVRAINTLALSAMVTQTTLAPLSAYAQIRNDSTAPGHQRPTVLTTGNGIPQVNITTPSAAGVSRNRLSQMDVDNRGAVVNNSRTHTPTQIGGWVQANPWLATGEARVILLEVNSGNPSQINGFIEIAGQRSEIIIANPSGLNVNGSGFINASRATLTTGEVNVNDAGVSGYTVRGGTITIGERGFDASLTDYTGILARAVAVNGPLVANELNLVTGANQIDASGQGATPTAGSGPAPSFALDVSQLGGMYAGKITLLSTEAGVGVRNAGGIQAGDGGLTLSANGDLVNSGTLASQGSASLSNSGRFDNSGSLSAASSLNLQSGGSVTNSGQIRSGGALSLQTGADLSNSGQIGAGTDATIVAGGQLSNTGEMSATGNLNLQGAQLSNAGTLNAGQQLSLSSAGRFDNAGQIVVQGAVQLQAPQGIGNTGSIQSQRNISLITAADVSNSGTVVADGALTVQAGTTVSNSGSLMGDQGVTIQNAQVIDNRGNLFSGAQTTLAATERIDNSGLIVGDGDVQLTSGQRIDNRAGAQIYAAGHLTAQTGQAILNEGRIGAGGDTRLQTQSATGRIDSSAGSVLSAGMSSSGAVPLGSGNLNLQGGSTGTIDLKGLTLAGQSIQAQAGAIDLRGQDLLTQRIDLQASAGDLLAQGSSLQAVLQLKLDASGQLRTDDATLGATQIDITAAQWDLQRARLQQAGTSASDARVQVSDRIDLSGATVASNAHDLMLAARELQLNRTTLAHSGTGTLTLGSSGSQTVVADDALLSTGGALALDAAALQASRSIVSAQTDARLNVQGALNATDATLVANGALSVQAASLSADNADLVGVQGGASLNVTGAASLRAGSLQSQAQVYVSAGSLDNTRSLINGQNIWINTHGGALSNTDGAVLAQDTLFTIGGAIDNQRGVLQAGGNAGVFAAGAVNNQAGQILAGGTLFMGSDGALDNRNVGSTRSVIAAGTVLTLNSQGLVNQGSDIKSAGSAQINAGSGAIDNSQGGLIATSGDLDLRGGDLDNRQTLAANQGIQARTASLTVSSLDNRSGALLTQEQLAVTASTSLDNTGGLLSSTGTLSIKDPQATSNPGGKTLAITNGAGGVIAANGATVIDARSLDNSGVIANAGTSSGGTLVTGSGNLNITLSGPLDNRAGAYLQAAGNLNTSAGGAVTNAGTLEAASELHLSAPTIHNQAGAAVRAGLIDLSAGTLANQGLINGGFTLLQAGSIENTDGGRIYGDHIAIAANSLTNRGGGATNPVIASRGDLDLGVGVVSNEEGALLLSLGNTRVGGSLDPNAQASGRAGAFINKSAEVDVFGNLTINAGSVQNLGDSVSYEDTSTEHVKEYIVMDPFVDMNDPDTSAPHPYYNVPLSDQLGTMNWYETVRDQHRADYIPNNGDPLIVSRTWLIAEYDRTTTVSGHYGENPARISVGGNMTVNADDTVNDMSSMLIGGNFLLTGGSLQNIDGSRSTSVSEVGYTRLSYVEKHWFGGLFGSWYDRRYLGDPVPREVTIPPQHEDIPSEFAVHTNPNHGASRPEVAQAVSVASRSAAPTAGTSASGTSAAPVLGRSGPGVVVRTLPAGVGSSAVSGVGANAASVNAPAIALPSNALFQLRIGAPAGYLVETDPEFTQQRIWLGSDYMLSALGYDPATQTQRLGDGFYEQKLVREQIAQLTGRRFLGSYTDDEKQYQALLDAGTAFGQAYQLKPGIALSREQMALLTSDIVWLVERTVQLPDGRTQRVLVPQLYALVDANSNTLSAGLISAKGVNIELSDGLFNAGTLAARENLAINAGSITNLLGQLQGNNIDLRASGSITSILGQIAARQNLTMNAGGNMVFMGGGLSAGGNASLSAGGDLLLLAYDTGKQVRAQSQPGAKGPQWSYENSTYGQTGVDIHVGGNFNASAGGNLVAQGVNANVGGSTNLSAGGDMQLTTALNGHVKTFNFFNRYKHSGGLIKIEQSIDNRDTQLTNSGNSWSSSGAMNLSAGGNMSIVGGQINSQGFSASAGGNYEERAAYDVSERVSNSSTKMSGIGTYLLDYANNHQWLFSGGQLGGRTETSRATTHVDSTRTAIVTNINAGGGTVNRSVGGDAFIEGSIVRGSVVNPIQMHGGQATEVAAVSTRHIENSVSTGTIRWQSTKSSGSIEQTLHMPQIHGTIPAGMSAYQGAGGVSVQLPAGSSVRATIEQLSNEPGKEYLKELGNRSDIDWQRVQALNKSLDFSKSGLTQEATLVVIIVVSLLTYGAASGAGASVAAGAEMTAAAGTAVAVTTTTAAGATVTLSAGGAAVASAVTAGITSLASTAAVSLINNQGDIGATLKELGSKENLQGLLLTMATAGVSNGILSQAGLSNVNAQSSVGQLLAKNTVQGITSAVLESAVLGTNLEDAIKSNLKGALINTVAAKGANEIGDAKLDGTSKAIAHALLGCAVGTATAGSSSGCAPGAAGGAIGELVAGLYADASGYDQLKIDANKPGADPALKQKLDVATHTMTELAKLAGAGGTLLIGGDANDMKTAMGTAQNAAQNNRQLHADEAALIKANAQRYADLHKISVTQAEKELTQQALKQVDSAYANTPDNARASTFLSDLTRAGADFYQRTGQTLFNETSNPALYNNHALNAQFLVDPGMRALYNQAQRPGAGANQFDGAAFALSFAAGDKGNLDQLSSNERKLVLSAMQQTKTELRAQGMSSVTLTAATDRLAADMQLRGEISFSERAQISKDAFLALAAAQGAATAAGALKAQADARIAVAEKTAAQAAEEAAIARARLESNARRDDAQQYDQYRDPNSTRPGGEWDWQTHAPNNGAVAGTQKIVSIQPGATLDRYGNRNGSYMSPAGTPYEARALPPGTQASNYEQFLVLKPFQTIQETIAPAFAQGGGGVQIRGYIPEYFNGTRPASVETLIQYKYLGDAK